MGFMPKETSTEGVKIKVKSGEEASQNKGDETTSVTRLRGENINDERTIIWCARFGIMICRVFPT